MVEKFVEIGEIPDEMRHVIDGSHTDEQLKLNGIDPNTTPKTFYGRYVEPTVEPHNPKLRGKYLVMSYIFPNINTYKAYMRYTLFSFIQMIFNEEIKAYSVLESNPILLENFNELFINKTAEEMVKNYSIYINSNSHKMMDEFIQGFPQFKKFVNNPELFTNDIITHMIRPYGIFDTREDADKYVTQNYDSGYKFKLIVTKMGKWTPLLESRGGLDALKAYDASQQETIDMIRNYHADQEEGEIELKSRMSKNEENMERINIELQQAEEKLRERVRQNVIKNFRKSVADELCKINDATTRADILHQLNTITMEELEQMNEQCEI